MTPRLVRRDYGRGHGYKLDGEKIPGVTTVIGTLDKPALVRWAAKTAAERAVNEWDALSELPLTERLERIQYGARDVTREAALRGTQIHDLGDKLAQGLEVDVPPEHVGPVTAYAKWMDTWGIDPIASETPLVSVTHRYAGTTDLWCRVGARDNAVALIDIKTGKGVYDETGLQLAAYRHAELMQPEKGVEIPVPPVDLVYVAHVLPDTVRMLPIVADERVFRTFLYLLAVFNEREKWADWPLVGTAEQP